MFGQTINWDSSTADTNMGDHDKTPHANDKTAVRPEGAGATKIAHESLDGPKGGSD